MGARGGALRWADARVLLPPHLAVHQPDARLVEQVDNQTPENLRQQKIANRLAQAQQSIDQDPLLQELIQTFDGQLDRQSIKPID